MPKPVRVKPEPKTPVDLHKLARALILLAEQLTERPKQPNEKKVAS